MRQLKCRYCGTEDESKFDDKQKASNKVKTLRCLDCKKKRSREYCAKRYNDNAEEVKSRVRDYAEKNKELISERRKEYRSRPENIQRQHDYQKKYREDGCYNARRWELEKQRLKTDPAYAMTKRLRNNLLMAVKRQPKCHNRKPASVFDLLGCDLFFFRQYFESKFKEGMTWEMFCNSDSIHIDHIIPVDAFDLSDIEQAKKCFHYTNLQPLWKWENLAKGSKLE